MGCFCDKVTMCSYVSGARGALLGPAVSSEGHPAAPSDRSTALDAVRLENRTLCCSDSSSFVLPPPSRYFDTRITGFGCHKPKDEWTGQQGCGTCAWEPGGEYVGRVSVQPECPQGIQARWLMYHAACMEDEQKLPDMEAAIAAHRRAVEALGQNEAVLLSSAVG